MRRCPPRSAGAWRAHFGVDVIDGIGSTEMLHIFLSNRPGDACHGTTGRPVPGYEVELRDDDGRPLGPGAIGELYVNGPSAALGYFGRSRADRPPRSRAAWAKTGDKFSCDADGRYTYARPRRRHAQGERHSTSRRSRSRARWSRIDAVLEAAVVGVVDDAGLIKPKAFVVVKAGVVARPELGAELQSLREAALGAVQVPARGSSSCTSCRRPRPARSSAFACGRR